MNLERREIISIEGTLLMLDVRVIAMTDRNLVREVTDGRFREDLYYRSNEFSIHIPALRERAEDIPILAQHFLQEIDKEVDGFAPDVFEMLQSYPWPGNVRELRNEVHRRILSCQYNVIWISKLR